MKRDDVRRVDQVAMEEYGISGLVLMENAGRGAAERIAALNETPREPVCLICGTGNNGGDGYVIARHLELSGFSVRILSLVPIEALSGDAATNAEIARKAEIPVVVADSSQKLEQQLRNNEVIVDCMLGTGATGEPRGIYGDAIRISNRRDARRVAIDLPTGLDCDTGRPADSTFRADLTLTFVAEKDGFSQASSKPFVGRIEVVGIGVPKVLLERFGVR